MSDREASDSDAPEEFTAEEGLQLEQGIRKIQKDSSKRVKQEGKERRRKWADRKTPKPSKVEKVVQDKEKEEPDEEDDEEEEETRSSQLGMLSKDIVEILAKQEKQVFSSDSEEEDNEDKKRQAKKKRVKKNGHATIILNDLPPPPCVQNSLDFLKKRKMQVPRSNAVLNNSKQALRLISSSGLLK